MKLAGNAHSWAVRIIAICIGLCFSAQAAPPAKAAPSAAPAKSAPAPQAAKGLDQARIHAIYNDGDFDRVVVLIDSFTNARKSYGRDDSIFIAKHLAVVYTANPSTREKGKGYMFRLLDLMPSAKIVDMFVSDEIDRIFDKVKEEFVVRQRVLGRTDTTSEASSRFATDRMTVAGKPASGRAAYYWIAGGVALAAVAGTAYYFLQPSDPEDKVYGFPNK